MKNRIAYCGLDCEKCDAYIATVNDDQELREKTADLWAKLNNAPILPEHINCEGCRTAMCIEKGDRDMRRLRRIRRLSYNWSDDIQ